jgi:hypothetical protein
MCKELPHEAISTCQSDLSLMNQSASRVHRTRRIISETAEDKEEIFNFNNTYTHTKRNTSNAFNFISSISKMLFGTLSSEDADYYRNKIGELESEQPSMLNVTKEKMTLCVPHCRQ